MFEDVERTIRTSLEKKQGLIALVSGEKNMKQKIM